MAKCDLGIEFDQPDRRFKTGETVSGRVHVRANGGFTCNALQAQLFWRAHGRGNTASGPVRSQDLFAGKVGAGWQRSFPFEMTLPQAPVTYHGQDLNVDWYLKATADIPWALDPKTEEDLIVTGAPGAGAFHPAYHRPARASNTVSTLGVFFGVLFLAAGGFLSLAGGVAVFGGLVMIGIGAGITFFGIRNGLAASRLGEVLIRHTPERPTGGDALLAEARFTSKQDGKLNSATFVLHAREIVTRGHGTDSTTYRTSVFRMERVAVARMTLVAGQPVALQERFELPAHAPPSFRTSDNRLLWTLTLHIDIPGWPDWKDDHEIEVRPRVA